MPTVPRILAVALAVACVAGLSGCDVDEPDPSPSASASADDEPVFASEEEALAAATEAYAAYLTISDAVSARGGQGVEEIADHVTSTYFDEQSAAYESLRSSGLHTDGATTFQEPTLQSVQSEDGATSVAVYICVDVSDVEVLNSVDEVVTPSNRIDRYPLVVTMLGTPQVLKIDGSETWAGKNFCRA